MSKTFALAAFAALSLLAVSMYPNGRAAPNSDPCAVRALISRGANSLDMYRVTIILPEVCPPGTVRLTRLITPNGGIVPPLGFFRLGAGSPRIMSRWIFTRTRVQEKTVMNGWEDVEIKGVTW